jgi:RNA polymerase sigma factor (sigma-70 family)
MDGIINILLLIEGCKRQNRNSQRKLYEHYFGYAMNVALRYSKNRMEAEEILNNAFLKVFHQLDKYNPTLPFKPWLRSVLTHTAIDYYRANKNVLSFGALEPGQDIADDEGPLLIPSEETDLLPILQKLSPAYRMVFNLYVMEEYKHEEIAEILGISANASRANLTRAKQALRKLIAAQNGEHLKMKSL